MITPTSDDDLGSIIRSTVAHLDYLGAASHFTMEAYHEHT